HFELMAIPAYAGQNYHMFYIVLPSEAAREELRLYLKKEGIAAVFHYSSLNKSSYFIKHNAAEDLPNSDRYSDCLLRLPLYADMDTREQACIIEKIRAYFR